MDEIAIEPTSVSELGPGRALVAFHMRARGQASGVEVEQEGRAIATLSQGLILRLEFLLPDEAPRD